MNDDYQDITSNETITSEEVSSTTCKKSFFLGF